MLGYLTLITALTISVSAAVYSILGLTAIFAAAFWPIVILGGSLEIGKIVTTLWLHKYWDRAEWRYKLYLSFAVATLMLLTSMGCFGFLSKAHLDQAVPSGDIAAQVAIFDDKIKTQRDNIEAARKALAQMDSVVDQTMSRSTDENGAAKSASLRRSQAKERAALQKDISDAQKEITKLQEARAPIASQARQVEAEVGPIRYIAALVYGDNPDANVLEKAVRWVIILIVSVFDPLALTLLLAATKTFEWEHGFNIFHRKKDESVWDDLLDMKAEPKPEPEAAAPLEPQLEEQHPVDEEKLRAAEANALIAEIEPEEPIEANIVAIEEDLSPKKAPAVPVLASSGNRDRNRARRKPRAVRAAKQLEDLNIPVLENEETWAQREIDERPGDYVLTKKKAEIDVDDDIDDEMTMLAKRTWKANNPNDTYKHQRELLAAGLITTLPWKTIEHFNELPMSDGERAKLAAQHAMQLEADNTPHVSGQVTGFGIRFPNEAHRGDLFVRVDRLPSELFKYNGATWIRVEKDNNSSYAYDEAYLNHLVDKISTGEYDQDLLTDLEREQVEQHLLNSINKT